MPAGEPDPAEDLDVAELLDVLLVPDDVPLLEQADTISAMAATLRMGTACLRRFVARSRFVMSLLLLGRWGFVGSALKQGQCTSCGENCPRNQCRYAQEGATVCESKAEYRVSS
jgi:hypothetical protein